MRLPVRIIAPVVAAAAVVGALIALLWWQLSLSSLTIQQQLRGALMGQDILPFGNEEDDGGGDLVLLHLRQGDLEALQGDWAKAQEEYDASVRLGGGIPALRKLAQAQLQRRDLDGVRVTIENLQREGARDEDLLLLQSIFLLRTGELVQAKELLEKAVDSPHRQYGLALLSIVQENHEESKTHLQSVATGDELTLRTYARIIQSAYEEYTQFPDSPAIHLTTLLSRALAQVQECELALPLIGRVVQTQDDYRDAWMVQGYCELTTERSPQALASFERAYALDPQKPEIQYFLGRAYARVQQYQDAQTFFGYALQNGFTPKAEIHERLAEVMLEAGNTSGALEQFRQMTEDPAATVHGFEQYVTLAIGTGQRESALEIARKAVEKFPSDAKAHELLGWALAENDQKEKARAALEKALSIQPDLLSARERLHKL